MGAASGLLPGWVSLRLLLRMVPATNSLRDVLAVHMDWRIIAVCTAVGALTSLIFAVAPAILRTRTDLVDGLRSEKPHHHWRKWKVAERSGCRRDCAQSCAAYRSHRIQLGPVPAKEHEGRLGYGPHDSL
jgi:hypothetical protein